MPSLKHFNYLTELQRSGIFFQEPLAVTKHSPKEQMAYAVGAALYMPSTRSDLSSVILTKKYKELSTVIYCLEDSIKDSEVKLGEDNIVLHMNKLAGALKRNEITESEIPLIFIRVRNPRQMTILCEELEDSLKWLAGFAFPKFSGSVAEEYCHTLAKLNEQYESVLYGMPIIETPDVLYKETRMQSLLFIRDLLEQYKDRILNVRIGATDFCGLFGIRRNVHSTIYDVSIIREVIADIINIVGRHFVISGPVWEYFGTSDRILKPQLRESPFHDLGEEGKKFRTHLISSHIDGLIKETLLDITNGINGKTVIHPSHISIVQSLQVVSMEEYLDACSILDHNEFGVISSSYRNKMNEIKPHQRWAEKTLMKSKVYGVYHEKHSYIDLLSELSPISAF